MVTKTALGFWKKDAAGTWRFIENTQKTVTTKKKAKSTRINLDAACDVDEISDPDCIAESGGWVDEDGNFHGAEL